MKVVIDTNVFVSSFFGGNPRKVIDFWKKGKVILCLSKDILEEYVDVLQRIGLKEENEIEELLSLFAKGFNILFTTKTPKIKVVKDDPEDDKFIECAVALKAEIIITGDKALGIIGEYMEIKILTPQQFLKTYKPHRNNDAIR
ncbi:MAG: putative toxin-antitoxin system toxin component, PIN family [Syntrophaceae bacterium]|nr:putative toxin-antitoxin system toxin component, PIN family [Syntrophaceae bacterium]